MGGAIEAMYRRWDRIDNILRHRLLTATPLRHVRARMLRRRLARFNIDRRSLEASFASLVSDGVQVIRGLGGGDIGLDPTTIASLSATVPGDAVWARGVTNLEGDALLATHPQAYNLGLSPALLDFVECYLGQPCLYLGAVLKRETVDGRDTGARRWHLDIEDELMVRVLIYLTPVGPGAGPFEFIDASRSRAAKISSGYRSGFLPETAMRSITADSAWTQVFGAPGDAILFDGTRVFHRAQPPRDVDRYSLTLAYVSRWPLQLRLSARLSRRCRSIVGRGLARGPLRVSRRVGSELVRSVRAKRRGKEPRRPGEQYGDRRHRPLQPAVRGGSDAR